ncbi:uncharacterized protein DUF982 [Rhizobium sp. BK251]|nr:uncharacterized protein DUF982 [Rhizobium sp. BK251]
MDTRWRSPVVLKCTEAAEIITITGPREALVLLACKWPAPHDESFFAAMQACSEALGRPEASERARTALLAAASDAGFPSEEDGAIRLPGKKVNPADHHSYRPEV